MSSVNLTIDDLTISSDNLTQTTQYTQTSQTSQTSQTETKPQPDGRVFNVEFDFDKKYISIYRRVFNSNDGSYSNGDLIHSIRGYEELLAGKHPVPSDDGKVNMIDTTILVRIQGNQYTYIGSEIISFETDTPIIEYYSPIGLDGIIYPFAVSDTESNKTYLIKYNVSIPTSSWKTTKWPLTNMYLPYIAYNGFIEMSNSTNVVNQLQNKVIIYELTNNN